MGGICMFVGNGLGGRCSMVLGRVGCAGGMERWCCSFQRRAVRAVYMTVGRFSSHES